MSQKDCKVARFFVTIFGTPEDFVEGRAKQQVCAKVFGGACMASVQKLEIESASNRCPWPVSIVASNGKDKIPYLSQRAACAANGDAKGMFFLYEHQELQCYHKPICVASVDWLDPKDVAVLAKYPCISSLQLEENVQHITRDNKKFVYVPTRNPILLELIVNNDAFAEQFEQQEVWDGYHKLEPDVCELGMKLTRQRMAKSPEVNLGSLYIVANPCLTNKALVKAALASTEIMCVTLELKMTYKPIVPQTVVEKKTFA